MEENFDRNDFFEPKTEENKEEGYTVTPEGGFYTKKSNEIIQDEVYEPQAEQPVEEPVREEPKQQYSYGYSTGNYGSYTPDYNPYVKTKKSKSKKRYGIGAVVLAAVLAAVVGAVSAMVAAPFLMADTKTVKEGSSVAPNNVSINIDETAESVVEAVAIKVTPSVVGIRTTTSVVSFFGGGNEYTGEGSGVIYSSDGYIITNYHVIADALSSTNGSKIEVFLDSTTDEPYSASVVGYNISTDLAVIKIDASGLAATEIGDPDTLKVGQYVITVGNPGGLEFMDSVTYGVISGLNRVVSSNSDVELIQTDAAINPGNSGGALVNTKGQLVGINSSKIVSEEYEGMGFAIPIDTVLKVCDDIIAKENEPEPYVGITISEKYSSDVLAFYGYPYGAVVLSVADGSPADNAGIRRGDIITKFNNTEIEEYEIFEQLLSECSPGEKITVEIYRSGRYYSTDITVGSNN